MTAAVTVVQVGAWLGGLLTFLILVATAVEHVFSPVAKLLTHAITGPLVVKLEELEQAFEDHTDYVQYHLGPNGGALPVHMRLTNVEEALRFAAIKAQEVAVEARETAVAAREAAAANEEAAEKRGQQ